MALEPRTPAWVRHLWHRAYWLPALVATAGLAMLLVQTYRASRSNVLTPGNGTASAWSLPWMLLALCLPLALLLYWVARRGRPNTLAVSFTMICAGLALLLGTAAYVPCTHGFWPAPVAWILELFVGGVESDPSPGAVCAATFSPGFQMARVLGLVATFIGAVAAAALLGRRQFTRLAVKRSRDIDVVIGLGPMQLELIRALVTENRNRPWRESWIDGRPGWVRWWQERRTARTGQSAGQSSSADSPDSDQAQDAASAGQTPSVGGDVPAPHGATGADSAPDPDQPTEQQAGPELSEETHPEPAGRATRWLDTVRARVADVAAGLWIAADWLTGLRKADVAAIRFKRTRTVVIEPDPNNPYVQEARQVGAEVLIADPGDVRTLELVTTRTGLRHCLVALRRLYAVTDDTQSNTAIALRVQQILNRTPRDHVKHVVPRIFVRFDDHRTSRAWRVGQLSTLGRALCQGLTEFDGPVIDLVQTLLIPRTENAWRVSEIRIVGDDELATAILEEIHWQIWRRYEVSIAPLLMDEADPGSLQPAPSNLRRVCIAGRDAAALVAQWRRFRPPWRHPLLPEHVQPDLPEVLSIPERDALAHPSGADRIAFVFLRGEDQAAAGRLAQERPTDFVFCLDRSRRGVEPPSAPGLAYPFGPQLVRPGLAGAFSAPVDTFHRAAEQQHAVYLGRWPTVAVRPPRPGIKVANVDWPGLAPFYRNDNLRQHRRLIEWFAQQHYRWQEVTVSDPQPTILWDDLTPSQMDALALAEFARWRDLRLALSWRKGDRNDGLRQHNDLGPEPEDTSFTKKQERAILARLQASGLTPVPLILVELCGRVTAVQLPADRTWVTANGDQLEAKRGDWWVTDAGREHSVADHVFGRTHRHVEADVYERCGQRWTRQAVQREIVQTLEGPAVAEPGMWIMSGADGTSWPVPAEHFARRYRPTSRRFVRVGLVKARLLAEPCTWETVTGDTMHAAAGDWLVTNLDGTAARSVAPEGFAATYTAAGEGRYRRIGEVTAYQALVVETVTTTEGDAIAEPGMWVVTDARGASWPVPDDVFRTSYDEIGPSAAFSDLSLRDQGHPRGGSGT